MSILTSKVPLFILRCICLFEFVVIACFIVFIIMQLLPDNLAQLLMIQRLLPLLEAARMQQTR